MFPETNRERRGHNFYPPMRERAAAPKLRAQDGLGRNAIVHFHYFLGGNDWWITEISRTFDRDGLAFGYVRLGGFQSGELGYVYLPEVEQLVVTPKRGLRIPMVVERDLYWQPVTVQQALERAGLAAA